MIFFFLFSSKGNSGRSAKKHSHSQDSKRSDEDSDEEWLRISQMHGR